MTSTPVWAEHTFLLVWTCPAALPQRWPWFWLAVIPSILWPPPNILLMARCWRVWRWWMHIGPLRSRKPIGRMTVVQWAVQTENCLQVNIGPVLRGVPRQVGAHLVEVLRKGLPGGLTVGLKDGQSFIRKDPRNKKARMRKEAPEWVQGLVSPPVYLVCIQVPWGCALWSWKVSRV